LLASNLLLGGCTVNHYHAPATNPTMVDNALLVIPEPATARYGNHSGVNQPIAKNSDGLKTSKLARPEEVLSMIATGTGDDHRVKHMDSVGLEVISEVDAYLNCYHEQADGAIIKVFPNRYDRRYWVYASQRLTFPDEQYFKFIADTAGSTEGFICLISQEDVLSKLPMVYQASTFQKLPVKDFDAVFALYDHATEQNLVARVVSYTVQ